MARLNSKGYACNSCLRVDLEKTAIVPIIHST